MLTNKWFIILLQLVILVFINKINGQTLSTVSCQTVLNDSFVYLTASHPTTVRYLTIQATFILENRYVAYYIGSLTYASSIDSLNGTVTVSFSDRTWIPSCGSGSGLIFCPSQNFNYKNTDIQTISIKRSGSIQYILNSWGNGKSTDQLQCYGINQPLYTAPTLQSASMFMMTLQKQEYAIPK
ncbi:unnamed protein product [Adineta steineri]|uniref:Uncharacterized protein n=1 Tax=Adineta steineri TaxID=433720 RepID=A0A815H552_9BILA|nr:unnamed protein product [Adineta steineri]CAF3969412.1 unnamed protein product [Adineta steineri]CAF4137958.1 unnamed protein product [Adineta steineri]